VTWRSVPGGCRRRARLVLTAFPVGSGRCWLFPFRSDLDAAGSFCSGRRKEGERKWDRRGSLTAGRNGPGKKEKAGRPGFPRNGRERARKQREKAGKPGFPRNGRERARKRGESGKAWVPSQWEGTGQEEKGESRKAGVPSQWQGTGQEERRKRVVGQVGSGVGVGAGARLEAESGSGSELSSAGSARPFYCHGGAARGRRLAAGAVGRKKHGFRGGFGRRG
jgi:hypothetical protein